MPNRVKVKRSYTPGVTPTAAELGLHEFAVNWADQLVFVKLPDGSIRSVAIGGGGSASVNYDYATTADLPASGNAALLYCTTDTGRLWRWTGSVWVEVGPIN